MAGDVVRIDALFEELVGRWTRDEPLGVDELLRRAGDDAEKLAHLIDAFFQRAPRRAPAPEATAAIAAIAARIETEPPLVSARVTARRRVRDVARELTAACGLPGDAERLVRSYYQRLEGGLLDPAGVSNKIWAVLEELFAVKARQVAEAGFTRRPVAGPSAGLVFQRAADAEYLAPAAGSAPAGDAPPDEIRREVERLFTGETAD